MLLWYAKVRSVLYLHSEDPDKVLVSLYLRLNLTLLGRKYKEHFFMIVINQDVQMLISQVLYKLQRLACT